MTPTALYIAVMKLAYKLECVTIVPSAQGRNHAQKLPGSPRWQAYKNAELAFIAGNFPQAQLDYVAPAPGFTPGPAPVNFTQAQLNYQQEALKFITSCAGK